MLTVALGSEFEERKLAVRDAKAERDTLQQATNIAFEAAAVGMLADDSKVFGDVHEAIGAVIIHDLGYILESLSKKKRTEKKQRLEETLLRLVSMAAG